MMFAESIAWWEGNARTYVLTHCHRSSPPISSPAVSLLWYEARNNRDVNNTKVRYDETSTNMRLVRVDYVCSNPLQDENETHERMFLYDENETHQATPHCGIWNHCQGFVGRACESYVQLFMWVLCESYVSLVNIMWESESWTVSIRAT